jgi:hypothetical protein
VSGRPPRERLWGGEVLNVKLDALERGRCCVRHAANGEAVEAAESSDKLG